MKVASYHRGLESPETSDGFNEYQSMLLYMERHGGRTAVQQYVVPCCCIRRAADAFFTATSDRPVLIAEIAHAPETRPRSNCVVTTQYSSIAVTSSIIPLLLYLALRIPSFDLFPCIRELAQKDFLPPVSSLGLSEVPPVEAP